MEEQILVPVSMVRKVFRLTGNRQARKILVEYTKNKEAKKDSVETKVEVKAKSKSAKKS